MSITALNPLQEPVELALANDGPAPRISTLTGKTLGLFSNVKLNSARLLEFVGEELQKDYTFNIVTGFYDASKLMPPEAWGDIEQCDAVILANGDCGSCSSSGIANAIELERRGIPTLLLNTKPFYGVVQTMAELRGMPSIPWAVLDHPIGSLDDAHLRQRAAEAAEQFRTIILQSPIQSSAAA